MRDNYDVLIVGAGPAGLGAADILDGHDLNILMVDENMHTGGQYLRHMPGIENKNISSIDSQLIARVTKSGIDRWHRAEVVDGTPEGWLQVIIPPNRIVDVHADFIILACGTREKFRPFPGWTLPGVVSTGAVQVLMKGNGMIPSDDIIVAGRGPLPLLLASEILQKKGRVRALLDETHALSHLKYLRLLASHISKLGEGTRHLLRVVRGKVPIATRTRVVGAQGQGKLEEVVTMKTNRHGDLLPNSKKVIPASFLAIGHGFVPNVELAVLMGCRVDYVSEKGGWIVRTHDELETSIENIFAAGEVTGVAGAQKSLLEGQIVGHSILNRLGLNGNKRQISELIKTRTHYMEFGKYVNSLTRFSQADIETVSDETILCRCENVTFGHIRQALIDGCVSWPGLKMTTRCGMGRCQGRTCGPILEELLTISGQWHSSQMKPYSIRFPVKPIPFSALCATEE
jgi:NADPH-dependent 2,4-dienoyl-CoA reductase/sulfur reductase-like enzyme